ncbi:MAG: response regulator, partial [Nitrospira sp. CR2.1]|nr:response regulator [Nitrospira sp. CR2.1]
MTEEWGAVLVVDDDADMRSLLCDVLQGRGHQCMGVGSGEEALQQLSEEDYAVVLTDLRMKGMLGTELLAEVKHRYPDIGVILMTAFGTVETAVDAMRHGASDYLTKPVK